ncbi:MAG: pitrilysin family protein [Rhodobacteraceae bacterium]|nr:pitrilysin family protein [Paracoccaceae bacterium]
MSTRLTTLPNGFRIASDQMDGLKSVAIGLYVLAGSSCERADQNGIAHFLEHMAFKGTKTRSALQISQEIENVGGSLNAYTSREKTAYVARVLTEDVPIAVDLLADITQNSAFAPEELELERNVILNEIRQHQDYPEDMVFEGLFRTVYPNQAFGRSVAGTTELVRSFNSGDLKGFTSQHYRANRMILSAAGGVDHDRLVTLVEKAFGGLPKQDGIMLDRRVYRSGEYRVRKRIEQVQFLLAFEAPPILHRDAAAAQIYAVIMGGGASSRLFSEAREARGLCYSVSAQCLLTADTGMLVIHAATGAKGLERLTDCCVAELRKSTSSITKEEVQRARTQIKVGILMAHEMPTFRVERMCDSIALHGRIRSIDHTIARFEAVAVSDVEKCAASMIRKQEPALALYGRVGRKPSRSSLAHSLKG